MIENCLLNCATENDIRRWIDYDDNSINWDYVANNKERYPVKLSETFMRELEDYILWSKTWRQLKSIDFIRENANRLNWDLLSKYYPFTQAQLKEFSDRINWKYIALWNELDKQIDIDYFLDRLDCKELLGNWTVKLDKKTDFKARIYAYGTEFLNHIREQNYKEEEYI